MKKTVEDLKKSPRPLVCLTAYTAPMAAAADDYCDLILVGDSVSMVLYGEETTQKADIPMMISHGKAVAKTAQKAFVVVDMPFGSYENDPVIALKNAQKIMDQTGCDAIKLEGGKNHAETIHYLVQNDIPVMGHIGLLPQSVSEITGYKVQGRDDDQARVIMEDAKSLEQAGVFSIVIEAVPEPLAAAITAAVHVPTIGIGASNACDGQILVSEDMLGLSLGRTPKFVKQYDNLNMNIIQAIQKYSNDVMSRAFPAPENTYTAKKQDELKKAS